MHVGAEKTMPNATNDLVDTRDHVVTGEALAMTARGGAARMCVVDVLQLVIKRTEATGACKSFLGSPWACRGAR